MKEKVIINGPITMSRETYKIWERVFLGYNDKKLEKKLFDRQEAHEDTDTNGISEESIQECFEAGLRVLDALSPNFSKRKEALKKEFEERLTQFKYPVGVPPF